MLARLALLAATASALRGPAVQLTRRTFIGAAGGAVLSDAVSAAEDTAAAPTASAFSFARTNPVWTPEREEIKGSQRTYNPKFVACKLCAPPMCSRLQSLRDTPRPT